MNIFLLLGILIVSGFIGAKVSDKAKIPQVVGYIIVGVLVGVSGFELVSLKMVANLEFISSLALALIGFTVGGELNYSDIKELGTSILVITIFESLSAFVLVLLSVFFLTKSLPVALIFGALASATAPAATVDVLWQYRSKGPLTTTIFAVVGLDDAAALAIYAFAASIAKVLISGKKNVSLLAMVERPFFEIIGSLVLGCLMGIILHYILKTTRHKKNELLIISLGFILICAGLANYLDFSLILTSMALGVTLTNFSIGNKESFDAIASTTPPIYLLFFILVGARMQIALLPKLGLLGLIYVVMRISGKAFGAYFGASISNAPAVVKKYLGFALISQAGVAIGLAIDASHTFKKLGPQGAHLGLLVINVIAATTFIFQIIGPPLTKYAIFGAKEANLK